MVEKYLLWLGLWIATFTALPVVVQGEKLPDLGVRKPKDKWKAKMQGEVLMGPTGTLSVSS